MEKNIIEIIQAKFPRQGWTFIRTTKMRPFGYIGYMLTIYSKDDLTHILDIKAKTIRGIQSQLSNK